MVDFFFPKPLNVGVVDVFAGWLNEAGLDGIDLAFEADVKTTPASGNK